MPGIQKPHCTAPHLAEAVFVYRHLLRIDTLNCQNFLADNRRPFECRILLLSVHQDMHVPQALTTTVLNRRES